MYAFDFLWHRMTPNYLLFESFILPLPKEGIVFPTTEILGRLYSCGFEIVKETNMHGLFFFAVMKPIVLTTIKKPSYLCTTKREEKEENFAVYKFRTMHAVFRIPATLYL